MKHFLFETNNWLKTTFFLNRNRPENSTQLPPRKATCKNSDSSGTRSRKRNCLSQKSKSCRGEKVTSEEMKCSNIAVSDLEKLPPCPEKCCDRAVIMWKGAVQEVRKGLYREGCGIKISGLIEFIKFEGDFCENFVF